MDVEFIEKAQLLKDQKLVSPHEFLGLQKGIIRLWRPGTKEVHIELFGKKVPLNLIEEGLFEIKVSENTTALDYKVFHPTGLLSFDPYNFEATFSEKDDELFEKGIHYDLHHVLGAHLATLKRVKGVKFCVWAKHAQAVYLLADYHGWDRKYQPMRKISNTGVWEIFIPGLKTGEKYKYRMITREGKEHTKNDPFGFYHELRPKTASIVYDMDHYQWHGQEGSSELSKPINIYELHLGSWKSGKDGFLNYRELAHELCDYCREMGFTHIELLPVMEHPLDESWGYQVTGFFSATSRYGTPEDLQYLIDFMHQNQIGVFLDWVPGHFPTDEFSLSRFDGTPLYEYSDPIKGFHPQWNTYIFDYKSPRVCNFLIASTLFWFEKFRIDGMRVDAVSSLIYLDFARTKGKWNPNEKGGKENLEAIAFLQHLNRIVHRYHPHALMMAEESSAFPKVTAPVNEGGLGFDLKWNMGWMNDTLRFFSTKPEYRDHSMEKITFSLNYVFTEKFMNVLSHDEVVHEKRSLIEKMPGSELEKFANLRLLLSYNLVHPGKALLFMGGEIGQKKEWDVKDQVSWDLLQQAPHQSLQLFVKELNHFYLAHSELWMYDFDPKGYAWVDQTGCILSYLRKNDESNLLCVHNFTLKEEVYQVPLHPISSIFEIFSSDKKEYGGMGLKNDIIRVDNQGANLKIAPLSSAFFQVVFKDV